jgi:hypothetical protein
MKFITEGTNFITAKEKIGTALCFSPTSVTDFTSAKGRPPTVVMRINTPVTIIFLALRALMTSEGRRF